MDFLKSRPFVISAPSGSGKSSLFHQARSILPILTLSVSHTTRTPRKSENNGIDYFFIDKESFQGMIGRGEFVEWAKVYGNYYGTSKKFIEENSRCGKIVVLDIDIQGALQIMAKPDFDPVFVFITPPSIAELERRLKLRGTETAESLKRRLSFAEEELSFKERYNYVLPNENLKDAAGRFVEIVLRECLDRKRASTLGMGELLRRLSVHNGQNEASQLAAILEKFLERPT